MTGVGARVAVCAAAAALGAGALRGQEMPTLSVAAYRAELDHIAEELRSGDADDARDRARALLGARVAFGSETLATDASVLRPVADAGDAATARRQAARVRALARALDASAGESPPATDHDRLERLRRAQALEPITKGGDVGDLPLKALTVPERVAETMHDVWGWIGDELDRFWEWLKKLWPRERRGRHGTESFELNLAVMALVAAVVAVLAVLAYRALKRSQASPDELRSTPLASSSRDEDPLSREAGEWETYAEELAARGRRREAIRAWYHAVLVTLFRTGLLHFHKGRTNWEYVSRLTPDAAWRSTFVEMTRAFDREWYGRDTSSVETLRDCADGARRILRALRAEQAPA